MRRFGQRGCTARAERKPPAQGGRHARPKQHSSLRALMQFFFAAFSNLCFRFLPKGLKKVGVSRHFSCRPLPPPAPPPFTVLGGCGKGKGSPYNDLCTLFTLDEFLGPRGFQNQRCTSFCCGLSKYSFLLLKRCRVPTGQGRRSADRRAQKPPERCWQPGVPLHHAPPGLVSRLFFFVLHAR